MILPELTPDSVRTWHQEHLTITVSRRMQNVERYLNDTSYSSNQYSRIFLGLARNSMTDVSDWIVLLLILEVAVPAG